MTSVTEQSLTSVFQDLSLLLGIPLALAGAFCMSLGAQYQHSGVEKVKRNVGGRASSGLNLSHLLALATRPSWLAGTLLLGLAVICQLGAISVAPLMVVQPLGVVALLLTTMLNARASGIQPTKRSWIAIAACVGGIAVFVALAAQHATKRAVTNEDVLLILAILLAVTIILLSVWILLRRRLAALFYVSAAGILYGFVATLAKVLIDRLQEGRVDEFLALCGGSLVVAAALGGYFVQSAYSSGPPDLVVAGLTVVDPLVAVVLAMAVLGELSGAPLWTLVIFVAAGSLAIWGVIALARHHPVVARDSEQPTTAESGADAHTGPG